jgi:hypothetical protein
MSETCPGRSADGSGPARPAPEVALLASNPLDGRYRSTRSRTRWATRSIVMSPSRTSARAPKQGRIARTPLTTANNEEHR